MKMRKVLSMLLATLMLLTMIPLGAVSVSAASPRVFTETEFVNKLNELRAKYPNGGTYSGTYYEGDKAYAWTCHGYACQMFYEVFGVRYYADGYRNQKNYTMGTIHAGDLVRLDAGYGPDTHTVFVTKVTGDRIYFTDANYRNKNDIRWDASYTKADFANRFTYKVTIPGNTLTGTGTHSHYHDKYVYYLAAHPHHKCYQCTCGDVAANYSTSTYVDTCLECTLPGTPSLSGMKETYTDKEPIVFEWEEVKNATHYNIWLGVESADKPGEWLRYDHIFYATNGMPIYLPVGNYQCFLQAYNSNVYWEDGSDWQYTASVPYYFSVIKECNHTYDNDCDATCNECGAAREAGLHNWDVTTGRCIICGEQTSFEYSEWSDTLPVGVTEDAFDIETKTVYRYRDNASHVSYGEWGAEQTSSTKPIESDTLTITSTTTYYNYYHICCNYYDGQNNVDSIEYGSGSHYRHTIRLTYELSAKNVADKGGKQLYGSYTCGKGFNVWAKADQYITYEYKYKTRTATNVVDYGTWTDWSETNPSVADNRNIETKTLYRYKIKHDHVYDDEYDPTCNECGAVRDVSEKPAEILYGDADGDGSVTVGDVVLLQQYLAEWDVTVHEAAADANGSGFITVGDVILLQQYLAEWDVTLGAG